MSKRAKCAVLFLAIVLALAVWLLWLQGDTAGSVRTPTWGRGMLKVSERTYYASRIWSVMSAARTSGRWLGYASQDQTEDSAHLYLVVDTAKKEMWIEDEGQVVQEYHTDLPPSMDWKLYRSTPDGTTTALPPLGRFRLPADSRTRRFLPEYVSLVGMRGRRESLGFSFSHNDSGQAHSEGPWSPQSIRWSSSPKQAKQDGSYESIIVSDDDYEKAKARFKTTDLTPDEPTRLSENKAAWRRVEKALYQEMERQVSMQGLPLQNLEVTCGPDCTAASVYLFAAPNRRLSIFHRKPASASIYLHIDYLGDDVWYAKSTPDPKAGALASVPLDLEFLIPVSGKIASENVPTLLAQGRRKQQEDIVPPSKWRVDLPNGASVEFIGICEHSNGGRQWWGPDGSPQDFALYLANEPQGPSLGDASAYEVAWRIRAMQGKISQTRFLFERPSSSNPRRVCDRYGNRLRGELAVEEYICEGSRTKTTLTIGAAINDGESASVTFKNISLVRGQDQGFEIIEGEATE